MNPFLPDFMKPTALAVLGVLLLPASALLAQSDFRVGNETGLEWPGTDAKQPAVSKKEAAAPVGEKKTTEITCIGETLFDAKAGMAVFVKEVKVTDPQFALTADKLTAYLKKAAKEPVALPGGNPAASPSATPSATPSPASAAKNSPASGLERAIAEGHVIITQDRVDEKTGEVTHYVGRAAKAEYNAVAGEMTLSGWPQIEQGYNTQVATEEGTVMIMDREGHLRTKGPSMTVIKTDSKTDQKKKP